MFSGEERELRRLGRFCSRRARFSRLFAEEIFVSTEIETAFIVYALNLRVVRTAFIAQTVCIKCCTVCTDFKGTAWSTAFINYSTEIEGLNSLFLARISREYGLYLLQYGLHLLLARKSRQYGAFNSACTIFWVVRSAFNSGRKKWVYGWFAEHISRLWDKVCRWR